MKSSILEHRLKFKRQIFILKKKKEIFQNKICLRVLFQQVKTADFLVAKAIVKAKKCCQCLTNNFFKYLT